MAGKSAPLGGEPVEGQAVVGKKKRDYKVTNRLQEGKRPLYAITFNFIDSRFFSIFASAGSNRVTVYQCLEGGPVAVLQAYVDEDKEESFYTVSWACDNEGSPLLVASGSNGVIRVIDCTKEKLLKSLVGHGDSVNELRTQALKPCLVISASKDESIRLWNVTTNVCILIMAGAGGHRNEVLSVDFHPSDVHQIASCGMDNTIKLWNIKDFWTYVEMSFTWTESPSKFPTKYVQFPVFNALVHSNYVDCTRWLGDFILSKSVDNEIVVWEPLLKEHSGTEGAVDVLQKYPVPDCDIWFIKFSCDFHFNTLAIGNREGKVFVWEPQSSPPNLLANHGVIIAFAGCFMLNANPQSAKPLPHLMEAYGRQTSVIISCKMFRRLFIGKTSAMPLQAIKQLFSRRTPGVLLADDEILEPLQLKLGVKSNFMDNLAVLRPDKLAYSVLSWAD